MAGTSAQIRSFEERARGSRAHGAEGDQAVDAYQEARARSREALMLDVYLTDGTIISFDYALMGKTKFLPEGKIEMHFGQDEVTAEGKNLVPLYTALTEHRVKSIREGTQAEADLKEEDRPHIESITVKEGVERPLDLRGLFGLLRGARPIINDAMMSGSGRSQPMHDGFLTADGPPPAEYYD